MADGTPHENLQRAPLSSAGGSSGGRSGQFRAFLKTRNGVLAIIASAIALALLCVLASNYSSLVWTETPIRPFINDLNGWLWFSTATCVLWLPLLLMLLDRADNLGEPPNQYLPIATSLPLGLLTVACSVAVLGVGGAFRADEQNPLLSPPVLLLMTGMLALAFIPRIANATLRARYNRRERRAKEAAQARKAAGGDVTAAGWDRAQKRYRQSQKEAEALGALIATIVVIGITLGAFWFGGQPDFIENVGLFVTFIVLGIFIVIVFLDRIADIPAVRAMSQAFRWFARGFVPLAQFYNFIDEVLVRVGAQCVGMGHKTAIARYSVLIATMACLTALSFVLPADIALITATAAFMLSLSVSRLWAWVEEDRSLAILTRFNQSVVPKIGFSEDYRDEALLGFTFVLVLIPITLRHLTTGAIFGVNIFGETAPTEFLPWYKYFGIELAKSLPIVDWADIYLDGVADRACSPVEEKNVPIGTFCPTVAGKHVTFAARAVVDLVLIAALLQALNVSSRNRQQKTLYAARQISRLDEILEGRELRRAVERGRVNWFNGAVDFRHYDEARLRELHTRTKRPATRKFIEQIFEEKAENVGYSMAVLDDLAEKRAPGPELSSILKSVIKEHETGRNRIEATDLLNVMLHVRDRDGIRDFKIAALDFAGRIGPPDDFAKFADIVIFSRSQHDIHIFARARAGILLTEMASRLSEASQVKDLIATAEASSPDIFGANRGLREKLIGALVTRFRAIGPPTAYIKPDTDEEEQDE